MVDFIIQVSVRALLSHVARSTEDGYTPPDQVEELQAAVVGVVTRLCGGSRRVQLHSCYLDPAHP